MSVLTFAKASSLKGQIPLRKRIVSTPGYDSSVTVTSYPNVATFTTRNVQIETLEDFAAAISTAGAAGEVLFKGMLGRTLSNESRAGVLSNDTPTDWVCLDFDKLPGLESIDEILKEIDILKGVSYVIQYASSHGLSGKLSAHVFMLLEHPIVSRALEAWLIWLNLTEAALASYVRLNPAGLSIAWPLDPVPARNTQLIYIAPPEFVGMPDPMAGKRRVNVVHRRHERLSIAQLPPIDGVIKARRKRLKELRDEIGAAPLRIRSIRGTSYIEGASAVVSEVVDTNDKFVRININGGDSAAYWFWKHDPTFVYSFKDETEVYRLEELDPDFYKNYIRSTDFKSSAKRLLIAFMEAGVSSGYRVGEYDPEANEFYMGEELVSDPWVVSKDKFIEFLKNQGYEPKKFVIPPGSVTFDPKNIGARFNPVTNQINRFKASRFMHAKAKEGKPPPAIDLLLKSVLGSDQIREHFLQWFAYLFAERVQVGTSWLFQGKQGTGKSVLVHNVLAPLIGESNFALITPADLADRFNDYIAEKLLVFIDEADLNKIGGGAMLNTRIKSMVGNKRAAVRRIYRAVAQIENYANLVLATNTLNAVAIPMDDRRFNVSDYQLKSLVDQKVETGKLIAQIAKELDVFASYLFWLAPRVDIEIIGKPLETDAKAQIQEHTLPSSEHVTRLIDSGDLESLFSYLSKEVQPGNYDLASQYERVLMRWLYSPAPFATREELMAVYRFHVPKFMRDYVGPISEGRFLNSQGFRVHVRKIDGIATRAYVVNWKYPEELKKLFPREGKPIMKVIK